MFNNILDGLHRFKKRIAPDVDLAQLPLISSVRKKIISSARKKIVENVNGYTMHVDYNDTLALSWHHVFEPATTEFYKKNVKQGQTVVDLGANIGYFTLLFSGLVGEHGHVYAFEPEPESVTLLRKNIELNSVKNVTIVEKALSNSESVSRLYINKINRGNHQIFDGGENREYVEVQTTSLDLYFSNKEVKVDWIKMDIEGAEVLALQGMRKVLQQNPTLVLVTELNSPGLIAAGSSVEEYINLLKSLKFEFEIIEERNNTIVPVESKELIGRFSQSENVHPNIICRRAN